MKKKMTVGSLVLAGAVFMAGCGNAIPEMDEETQALVVEYAAGIVEKYDMNHPVKLKEIVETEENAEEAATDAKQEEEETKDEAASSEQAVSSDVEIIDATAGGTGEKTPSDIGRILKLDGIDFSFEGYETDSFYPNNEGELYLCMNATEGNQLLILKFTAQNQSQEDKQLDIINSGTRFKIEANGDTRNALTTMLLNDMANYQGTLPAGGSETLVLVREIPMDQANAISSLSLIMKNADETATISLN